MSHIRRDLNKVYLLLLSVLLVAFRSPHSAPRAPLPLIGFAETRGREGEGGLGIPFWFVCLAARMTVQYPDTCFLCEEISNLHPAAGIAGVIILGSMSRVRVHRL